MDPSKCVSAFSLPAIADANGSNNTANNTNRDSPTATCEFPATPRTNSTNNKTTSTLVTPSPTAAKTASTTNGNILNASKDTTVSKTLDDKALAGLQATSQPLQPMIMETMAKANTRSRQQHQSSKPTLFGPNDEKTIARQARFAALAQQQQPQQPHSERSNRDRPSPDISSSTHGLAPPIRRNNSRGNKAENMAAAPNNTTAVAAGTTPTPAPVASATLTKKEDPDIVAKRQGRVSALSAANVRKMPLTSLARRTTTASSVSTNSSTSTTLTQNTIGRRASAAQIYAVNLVLESDSDDDGYEDCHTKKTNNNVMTDVEATRLARSQAITNTSTAVTRRQTVARAEAADAAVKRSVNMTPDELRQRSNRRSRVTAMGLPTNSNRSSGSVSSSIGAHSVTGGRRTKAEGVKGKEDDEDDDAVHDYLSHIASEQQQEQQQMMSLQFVPTLASKTIDWTCEEIQADSDKKIPARRVSSRSSEKMQANSLTKVDEVYGEEYDDVDSFAADEEFVGEAEAGVVIDVQVGAFAVSGVNGEANDDDGMFDEDIPLYDDHIVRAQLPVGMTHSNNCDPSLTDPYSALFCDPELAVGSTTIEAYVPTESPMLEAVTVLPEEPQTMSAKALRRLRMLQCTVLCLALGAIAAVIAIAATRPDVAPFIPWEKPIPTIQGWNQVGGDLLGPLDEDKSLYGFAIAITGEADRIAIGVPGRDKSNTELLVGEVHVMDWNGTQWRPSGNPIVGPGHDAQAGTAVAMSKDGKRIAIGSPFYANGGHVAIYEEVEPEVWVMLGQALTGNSSNDDEERFGGSIALSDDGSVLAVGAVMGEGPNGTDNGYLKVFALESVMSGANNSTGLNSSYMYSEMNEWKQKGKTVYGENPGDFFGWSLAMSASGSRILVGGVGNQGEVGEFAGHARAFDFDEDSMDWVQAGQSIPGLASFDSFGSSVAMSKDGGIVAIGAIGHSDDNDGVDIGHVRVFRFGTDDPLAPNTEATWHSLGQTLTGQSAFDSFGYSISLSQDGKTLAVGAPRNDEFAESSGHVQIFELEEATNSWTRRGSTIGGSFEGRDLFGWSVALSANGSRVVGGAPFYTFDGRVNDVGSVKVYDALET